jgi:uncharacterized iron-regulated membrane protein
MHLTNAAMPPKETSSTVIVLLILALIGLLFYGVWRWMQRTSPTPAAPMHSHLGLQASGARLQAYGPKNKRLQTDVAVAPGA